MNKNSKYKQIRNLNNFEIKQIQIPNKNSKSKQISKSKTNLKSEQKIKIQNMFF
jgi:hypothetical protein